MSRNPGIGKGWLEKYGSDVYPDGYVVHQGKKEKPPRYYDNWYEEENPAELREIKARRRGSIQLEEQSTPRLVAREKVAKAKHTLRKRKMES